MIDPAARLELLAEHAADPEVAAIILDVVLGYGANPDPAATLAPACAAAMADGGPQVVAYVLGTDADPQGYRAQRAALVDAGCIVDGDRVPRVARRGRHRGGRSDRRDPASVTISSESADRPRVALVSYSTKPRGGVVHTLYLAEELGSSRCTRSGGDARRSR